MTRRCGDCQACCSILPVRELKKPANTRCTHQRFGKGCTIYERRPRSCVWWSCRWLVEDDTAGMRRPDRAGYVIDMVPDFITYQEIATGRETPLPVIQVWVDPRRPEAHRDHAFRAYAERRAEDGIGILLRYGSDEAIILMAPALNSLGEWVEIKSCLKAPEHSAARIAATLSDTKPTYHVKAPPCPTHHDGEQR